MSPVQVWYHVRDLDAGRAFYTGKLGFAETYLDEEGRCPEQVGVVRGAAQDRLIPQVHALLARLEHPLAHLRGLCRIVTAEDQLRPTPGFALGVQPPRKGALLAPGTSPVNPSGAGVAESRSMRSAGRGPEPEPGLPVLASAQISR